MMDPLKLIRWACYFLMGYQAGYWGVVALHKLGVL